MDKRATMDEVSIAFFTLTLLVVILAWTSDVFLLWILALFSLSVNLWMEAYKEFRKGDRFFFSQQLLRGCGVFVFSLVLLFI